MFKHIVFYSGCVHFSTSNRKVIPLSHKTLGFSSAEIYAICGGCARVFDKCPPLSCVMATFGHNSKSLAICNGCALFCEWVRSLLSETLANSVQMSFPFGDMLKSHAIYSGCAHFLQNPRKKCPNFVSKHSGFLNKMCINTNHAYFTYENAFIVRMQ